jgi:hypothetical protein
MLDGFAFLYSSVEAIGKLLDAQSLISFIAEMKDNND